MRTYTSQPVMQWIENKVTCNKCGQTYDLEKELLEEWQLDFMHELKVSFGYASSHDGETWSFDICNECLEEFVKSFKYSAKVDKWLE